MILISEVIQVHQKQKNTNNPSVKVLKTNRCLTFTLVLPSLLKHTKVTHQKRPLYQKDFFLYYLCFSFMFLKNIRAMLHYYIIDLIRDIMLRKLS